MVGEDRPATTPAELPSQEGDPFGGLPAGALVGKYEIVELLGQGGFGITYRARDAQLRRDVAIKEYLPASFAMRQGGTTVLPRSTHTAEDFRWGRERFLDEARTLATLEDAPGIVNVHDFMEANGTAYMVMALVRGETLESRLKRERRLPQPAIEQLLYPLLDGLERVHEAGFLHRDIKPANILLDATGRPTLIDFGASRVALQGRTQAMTAVFTPGYAAFEQMTSGKQGPWTDIYALAGTLYHCIAGTPPPGVLDRMAEDTLLPAAEIGKGRYAPILLAAIDSGLALKAPDRPQSIADWRRMLSGVGGASLGAETRALDALATRRLAEAPARRRPALPWIAAAIVLVALAGAGGWVVLRPPQQIVDQGATRAADDARRAAQEEAARKAAEARAEAEATRRRQEDEIRRDAEARVRTEYEVRRRAEEEARAKLEAEAATRRREEETARAEAAAREKIEADARRKAEDEARKAAEEKARAEAEARRQADDVAKRPREGGGREPKSASAAPAPARAARHDGKWTGQMCRDPYQGLPGNCWRLTLTVEGGKLSGSYFSKAAGQNQTLSGRIDENGAVQIEYDYVGTQVRVGERASAQLSGQVKGTSLQAAGRSCPTCRNFSLQLQKD